MLVCPSDGSGLPSPNASVKNTGLPLSYALNIYGWAYHPSSFTASERNGPGPTESQIENPASKIAIAEARSASGNPHAGLWSYAASGLQRHMNGANYVFFAGHAKWRIFKPWPTSGFSGQRWQDVEMLYPEWCPWSTQ